MNPDKGEMNDLPSWWKRAEQIEIEGRAFIGGEHREAVSGARSDLVAPRDGSTFAQVAECNVDDVDLAVISARGAFESRAWSGAHPRIRKQVLFRLAELLLEHRDEFALLISLDMGKPITDATNEVDSSVRELRFFAESVDKIFGEVAVTSDDAFGMMTREPAGVVAAITPWNFPLMMPIYKVAPALAMGNSVILKPAEQAPLAAIMLADLALRAGLPEGVLNVVPGIGSVVGTALAQHVDVDAIAFTGSTAVGKLLLQHSGASNMKPVWLECGGKSPNIVLADAPDFDKAASYAASAIFHGSGQVCNAGSRLLVEEAIHDDFIERLVAETEYWRPRDPLDEDCTLGPLVSQPQMERVLSYIEIGKREGAQLVSGGKQTKRETGGFYIEPTILTSVSPEMTVARDEIFGPVLSVISVSKDADIAAVANDSDYGLAAAIWTADLTRAHRLARQVRAGTVYINCYDRGDNSLPFGGYKQSGIGVDRSLHALDKYSRLKTTWIDLTESEANP